MPVIRTEKLSKTYRAVGVSRTEVNALSELTMQVEEREIFGFLGPNGAGKTTTMKILMGLIFPTSGEAWIFDRPLGDLDAKRRLGFLPEQPYFYDQLTGEEILDYFARLFGIDAATRARRSRDLLERVGLGAAARNPLRSYSKGMLQRIGIAQALINDPELVVLDEPMSGLDPVGRKEVRDIILALKAEKRTVFFSTHILADVEVVCDRVAILSRGKIAALSPLRELLELAGESVEIVVAASETVRAALQGIDGASVSGAGDRIVVHVPQAHVPKVLDVARGADARILALSQARRSLEEIFMAIAGPRQP